MDHLPRVQDPALPPLRVPYYDTEEYDCGEFHTFPLRRGVDTDELKQKLLGNIPMSDEEWRKLAGFLQAWLYVGTMYEFSKFIIRVNGTSNEMAFRTLFSALFVRTTSTGHKVISTEDLPDFLQLWVEKMRTIPDQIRRFLCTGLLDCLETMKQYMTLINVEDIDSKELVQQRLEPFPLEIQELFISIIILQTSLILTFRQAFFQTNNSSTDMPNILVSIHVINRMLITGRCPHQIRQLMTHLGPVELVYAAQIRRLDTHIDHGQCNFGSCMHSRVDEATYQTRHTPDCDGCSFLSVDQVAVRKCFEEGGYPLVYLKFESDGRNVSLGVVSSNSNQPYVAISHVWSDGMGNPHANSLPSCQVVGLAMILHDLTEGPDVPSRWSCLRTQLDDSTLFWIDTLCIPVDPALRKHALRKLHDTYANAQQVVVLDNELRNTTWMTPLVETLMRLRLSKWITRLWTLEEAVLTPEDSLCFLFQDGMFLLNEEREFERRDEDSSHFLHEHLQKVIFRPFGRILEMKRLNKFNRVVKIRQSMATREVTKPGDEALILATLLEIDTGALSTIPSKDRMQRLLHMARYWPAYFIFDNLSKRMETPGYRWAPNSFLNNGVPPHLLGSENLSTEENMGEVISPRTIQVTNTRGNGTVQTDGGLLVNLPGFQTQQASLPPGISLPVDGQAVGTNDGVFLIFDITSNVWYGVRYLSSWNQEVPWNTIRLDSNRGNSTSHIDRRFHIILPAAIPANGRATSALVSSYATSQPDRILYVEYKACVTVFRLDNTTNTMDEQLPMPREMAENILRQIWETGQDSWFGVSHDESQRLLEMAIPVGDSRNWKWCVG